MRDPENKRYLKLGITGTAVVVAGALCVFLLLHLGDLFAAARMIWRILSPFVYGAVIAYLLAPLCGRLETLLRKLVKRGRGRWVPMVSIVISLLLLLFLVSALLMLVLPQVWKSVVHLANAIPDELAALNARLHNILQDRPQWQAEWDAFSQRVTTGINEWLKSGLLPAMEAVVGELGSQVSIVFTFFKNLFLGLLVSIYILSSRKRFAAQSRLVVYGVFPERAARWLEREARYADRMFNGFLMGKLLDSAIVGLLCFVGTALMRMPSAALLSVIVGVTNIIPFFGPFLGAVPCALLLLLESPGRCIPFLIFIVLLQQLDGNVIGPRILGNSTGLSSFWVMLSILLFGGLWGVAGMIVGVPLCAVLYDVLRQAITWGLKKHGRGALLTAYESDFHRETKGKRKDKRA